MKITKDRNYITAWLLFILEIVTGMFSVADYLLFVICIALLISGAFLFGGEE